VGLVGLAAGAALTPGVASGDAGRVLTTFLGFLSAGLLPTITLLINNMTASGRSVQAIERLERELQAAIDALFLLFGCVALSIGALVSLAIPPATFMTKVPYLTTEILPRIGQALVVGPTALVVWRAGRIPGIMRRALEIRREIAVDEARRKVIENAPTSDTARQGFATAEDFGRPVSLQDLATRKRQ
jgi:hypothetical protein